MKPRQNNKTKIIIIPHAFMPGSPNQVTYAFNLQDTCGVWLHPQISYIANSGQVP